ncbi:stage V sporulation protein D (sporulation-specific penicillin-binding protein) [Clostridium beijerinckii]|uniref:Stage V sporulation protein D (Sporulation-specific penicillin-binding protein) n=1 Tax=Clostridium beijerinckii TaxID=1520 RepID=A0AAX0B174_CLOBE|nr:stage V sporulation protein D (sporulation-specific penicillin-binding protein) [Clostridium beijerinckii]NRT33963.1 stage V sporulation protein D (sporulation-specific penicillin-binding protein) [Clostridium beijerinckii]NRT46607.1 stage V sporulation protein D (sporulation-specific penicillin-binding protein) [Clostridium beijerinckii]NRT88619.1 stage V sporulation protein D (sporulation-specific penicillin-binding protein) [Clostridium beijerinckii]NRU40352.1 stage V sporulation protein 
MKKKKHVSKVKIRKRTRSVAFSLTAIFAILIIRLSYIVMVDGKDYSARAEEQWTSEVKIDAKRGEVLDRNGNELAVSANVYRVDFDLNSIRNYLKRPAKSIPNKELSHMKSVGIPIPTEGSGLTNDDIAPVIAKVLNMDVSEIKADLEKKLPSGADAFSVTVARKIEKDIADKVKELNINGIIVSQDTKRYYPNNNFLSHVLGTTDPDGKGLSGVELQYNSYLSGIPGMKVAELDKNNEDLPYTVSQYTEPVNGKDVTLTIDENIQNIVENIAQKAYKDDKAKEVSILVMNPKTGEVLGMVNKPDFDPNNPYDGASKFDGADLNDKIQKMWRNRLVSDTFEPGSIFKVITTISGLENNVANKDTQFVDNGSISVGGIVVKDAERENKLQNLLQIIQNSSNVCFVKLGQMIGKDKLYESINKFGFGKVSGIDLPGEASGIVKPIDKVSEADLATISFGQTNTVNSVQYMAAFNAIANGGTLIQPHVMKEITHNDENNVKIVDETFKPTTATVASAEKTAELRSYLEGVVTGGTATGTFIDGYHIGGKTGTAEKVVGGKYGEGKYISSFVGMAPANDPKVTVMITVDEPSNGEYYASQVAVPYAKLLFTGIFDYLNSASSNEKIVKDIIIPEVRNMKVSDAEKVLKDKGLDCNIDGNEETIVSMKPYPGSSVKEGSKITLYTSGDATYNNNVVMPNVRGYSKEDATTLLKNLGITATFEGNGVVSVQNISEGEVIPKGTTAELILSSYYED